jgi:hypothetical protein
MPSQKLFLAHFVKSKCAEVKTGNLYCRQKMSTFLVEVRKFARQCAECGNALERGGGEVPNQPPPLQQDVRTVVEELQPEGQPHESVQAAVADPVDGAGGRVQYGDQIAANAQLPESNICI